MFIRSVEIDSELKNEILNQHFSTQIYFWDYSFWYIKTVYFGGFEQKNASLLTKLLQYMMSLGLADIYPSKSSRQLFIFVLFLTQHSYSPLDDGLDGLGLAGEAEDGDGVDLDVVAVALEAEELELRAREQEQRQVGHGRTHTLALAWKEFVHLHNNASIWAIYILLIGMR